MDLLDYPIRICVAGSRSFHDLVMFNAYLRVYLSWAGIGQYAFISGAAKRGADRLVIDWAKENNEPCFEFPADWDSLGKRAGMVRNAEMREVATHLLVFWDKESKGTLEMIEQATKKGNISVFVIYVEPDAEWEAYRERTKKRWK